MNIKIDIDGNEALIIVSGNGKQIVRSHKCIHSKKDFDTGELKYWLDQDVKEFEIEQSLTTTSQP